MMFQSLKNRIRLEKRFVQNLTTRNKSQDWIFSLIWLITSSQICSPNQTICGRNNDWHFRQCGRSFSEISEWFPSLGDLKYLFFLWISSFNEQTLDWLMMDKLDSMYFLQPIDRKYIEHKINFLFFLTMKIKCGKWIFRYHAFQSHFYFQLVYVNL